MKQLKQRTKLRASGKILEKKIVILHSDWCNITPWYNVIRSLVSYYALLVVILCAPWCNAHVQCMFAVCCVRG